MRHLDVVLLELREHASEVLSELTDAVDGRPAQRVRGLIVGLTWAESAVSLGVSCHRHRSARAVQTAAPS